MINVTWLAEVVFFVSYFVAWVVGELGHSTWLTVSAIAAIVVAAMLVFFNGSTLANHPRSN